MTARLVKRAVAECLGTALLLAVVVGSGVMAEKLAAGNEAIALLANTAATGAALYALILSFDALSGSHFNPAVSLVMVMNGEIPWRATTLYMAAQTVGATVGVWIAHLMFGLPILQTSSKVRTGIGQWAGEFIATFGLIMVIECGRRRFREQVPAAVAAYIVAACWFTSSSSFANPAVTIARSMTDTFAGIGPGYVPAFFTAQILGAIISFSLFRWLFRNEY